MTIVAHKKMKVDISTVSSRKLSTLEHLICKFGYFITPL